MCLGNFLELVWSGRDGWIMPIRMFQLEEHLFNTHLKLFTLFLEGSEGVPAVACITTFQPMSNLYKCTLPTLQS